jgi:hypothetical protein
LTERAVVHAARIEEGAVMAMYSSLPNQYVSAANGVDYAYRDARWPRPGGGDVR